MKEHFANLVFVKIKLNLRGKLEYKDSVFLKSEGIFFKHLQELEKTRYFQIEYFYIILASYLKFYGKANEYLTINLSVVTAKHEKEMSSHKVKIRIKKTWLQKMGAN